MAPPGSCSAAAPFCSIAPRTPLCPRPSSSPRAPLASVPSSGDEDAAPSVSPAKKVPHGKACPGAHGAAPRSARTRRPHPARLQLPPKWLLPIARGWTCVLSPPPNARRSPPRPCSPAACSLCMGSHRAPLPISRSPSPGRSGDRLRVPPLPPPSPSEGKEPAG